MMNSNIKTAVLVCLQSLFFLFIDVCLFALFNQPICYGLLCCYVFYALSFHGLGMLVSAGLLVTEIFFFSGRVALPIAYCFLMGLVSFYMRQFCYINRYLFLLIVTSFLLLHKYLLEGMVWGGGFLGNDYTFIQMSVNIIIIGFLSLKLRFQSSQGNRCLG